MPATPCTPRAFLPTTGLGAAWLVAARLATAAAGRRRRHNVEGWRLLETAWTPFHRELALLVLARVRVEGRS